MLLSKKRAGFTLVELMLIVAIISLLAGIAIPNYLRTRKRSQAGRIMDDLRALDHAMELYSVEYRKSGIEALGAADVVFLRQYVKADTVLYHSLPNDLFGNPFVVSDLRTPPRVNTDTFNALSDVAPADFWAPYGP